MPFSSDPSPHNPWLACPDNYLHVDFEARATTCAVPALTTASAPSNTAATRWQPLASASALIVALVLVGSISLRRLSNKEKIGFIVAPSAVEQI